MKRKPITYVVVCILVILLCYSCIQFLAAGTYFWGMITPHQSMSVSDVDTVEHYNDYYEQGRNPQYCYSSPGYTESELFGSGCRFILFGEVLECKDFVFEEDRVYSCHIISLRVEKGIYGGLKKGQKVYLLCRWNYETYADSSTDPYQVGSKGIFISNGLPVKIHLNQSDENIMAIGSMHRTSGFHYCLTDLVDGLEELDSKKEVLAFWKEQGWIAEEE